jgi:glycyl-tRNA synthetase
MLEIGATCLTPEIVLKTSGHVDRFTDFAVKDLKTGICYRADKLVQEFIEKTKAKKKNMKPEELDDLEKLHSDVDKMNEASELDEVIQKYTIKSPDGNDVSGAYKFNLMFDTQIGPTGGIKGYLRPETAQGHFVNFRKLLEFNGGKIPFASASIGLGFRNEIAPRSGLLRVREFTMAEIEHYVDPTDKNHKKFADVKDMKIPLLSKESQKAHTGVVHNITLQEAVDKGIINNETLAYFLARSYLFLTTIGISKDGIRFRQHTEKEMAHYASDCWDAEVETSYGWIEVAGHADRTCYDLSAHMEASKTDLMAAKQLKEPVKTEVVKVTLNKGSLYKTYANRSREIVEQLERLTDEEKTHYLNEFTNGGSINLILNEETINISGENCKFEMTEVTLYERKFIPGVIEPSFGIGRITYCVMEHAFKIREKDEKRTFFNFPPIVAPYKVSVLPLIHTDELLAFVEPIRKILVSNGVSYKIDDVSDSVGRRYARTDEIGIPFGITIDDQTPKDGTVTLREVNTMKQIRISVSIILTLV